MPDQQPHTPTTEEVREVYRKYGRVDGPMHSQDRLREFHRWLATVEAAAEQRGAIKAWRQGYVNGFQDERHREQIGAAEEPNRANPYITDFRADQEGTQDG